MLVDCLPMTGHGRRLAGIEYHMADSEGFLVLECYGPALTGLCSRAERVVLVRPLQYGAGPDA